MSTITRNKIKLGPEHQGQKMSLKAFEFAEGQEGYRYELARGYVIVSGVPNYLHVCLVVLIRDALVEYKLANPGRIHMIIGAMDCKLLIPQLESERHPDLAIYFHKPKGPKNRTMWRTWIPELAIEIVSPSSADRDYVQKREEYWEIGIKEYWIVDAKLRRIKLLRRGRADWIEKDLHEGDVCETKLLPGFKLPCQTIFAAAKEAEDEE